MSNKHYRKWIFQMPLGFLLTSAGILVIVYAVSHRSSEQWLTWGIIGAIIFNSGLGILGNAFIHKMKSDLIQKERKRKIASQSEENG